MVDYYKLVKEDIQADIPSLDAVIAFANHIDNWEPIVNEEGDNIIGYHGGIDDWVRPSPQAESVYCKYTADLKKPGEHYALTLYDSWGVLGKYSGDMVQELFKRVNGDFEKALNEGFKKRTDRAKEKFDLIKQRG